MGTNLGQLAKQIKSKKPEVRTRRFTLLVNSEEYERYSKTAEAMGMTLSEVIRGALDALSEEVLSKR